MSCSTSAAVAECTCAWRCAPCMLMRKISAAPVRQRLHCGDGSYSLCRLLEHPDMQSCVRRGGRGIPVPSAVPITRSSKCPENNMAAHTTQANWRARRRKTRRRSIEQSTTVDAPLLDRVRVVLLSPPGYCYFRCQNKKTYSWTRHPTHHPSLPTNHHRQHRVRPGAHKAVNIFAVRPAPLTDHHRPPNEILPVTPSTPVP